MINGFACFSPREALQNFSYEIAALSDAEVLVQISHCGICHSDIHLIDNDWGLTRYPFVPGHEIVGTVAALGENVTALRLGQRVGIGWQANSCGKCELCQQGLENLCARSQPTCVGRHGGFAEAVKADQRFVFAIPDEIPSAQAAPLLCGGVTVYAPLHNHNIGAGAAVAVVGIGGLGHLALQFARARGCTVTAISTNAAKAAEAAELGAAHFLLSMDSQAMKAAANKFDFIMITASADIDVAGLLGLLRPRGKICVLGVLSKPMQIPAFALIGGEKSIVGSPIGSPAVIRAMLADAATHKVRAMVETVPMMTVNAALDKVRAGQARYRMVLEAPNNNGAGSAQ